MTRQLSVRAATGKLKADSKYFDPRPTAGTRIRRVYDFARTGQPFCCTTFAAEMTTQSFGRIIESLRDEYGMEFRTTRTGERSGTAGRRPVEYHLVGEWEGPYFVPIERILQEDAA